MENMMTEEDKAGDGVRMGLSPAGPLVFISHDTRDAALAEATSKLLSSVSAGMLKTFRSSDKKGTQGIEYGTEWYPKLMTTLDTASDVVCLLTARSLGRPWMLYEAGVAKGKLDIPVHGLALGVPLAKASVGPFAQFQNCDDDVDSITKLVVQLIERLPNADPDLETVAAQVEVFKGKVDEILATTPDEGDDGSHEGASPAALFEEVKVMFQDLPARLERSLFDGPRSSRLRGRRFHPEMVHEAVVMVSRSDGRPGLAALVAASFVRDDVPWLYEIAAEAYRASLRGDVVAERRGFQDFMRACRDAANGPFSISPGSGKDTYMILHEMPLLLERYQFDHKESPEQGEGD